MKYLSLFFLIIMFSCSPLINKKFVTLSTYKNEKFLISHLDSIKIDKLEKENKKFADSCEKYKLNCFFDGVSRFAEFPGGVNKFRKIFYENLKIQRNTKSSVGTIKLLIGKNNLLENFEISGFKNEKIKGEIARVLKLPQLSSWASANILNIKTDYEITLYLYIKTKQPD